MSTFAEVHPYTLTDGHWYFVHIIARTLKKKTLLPTIFYWQSNVLNDGWCMGSSYHTWVQMEMTASLMNRGSTHTQSIHSVFTAGWSDGLKGGWLVKRWHMMNWRPLSAHLPSSSARLHHRQAWCHPVYTTRDSDGCGIFNQKAGQCCWMDHISLCLFKHGNIL